VRARVLLRLGVGVGMAMAALVVVGPPLVAHAEVSGPGCTAHLAGVDAARVSSTDQSTAIHVQKTDTVAVDLAGEPGQTGVHVDYGLAGGVSFGKDGSGTHYAATVSDYVNATGLYLVQARSVPAGTCTAAALVDVGGSPVGTLPGDLALAATLGGAVMVAGGAVLASAQGGGDGEAAPALQSGGGDAAAITRTDLATIAGGGDTELGKNLLRCCGFALPMALLMTTMAMMGALPVASGGPVGASRVPRVRWRPRLSVLGILGGILGSAGAVVFMELNGNVYPTRRWAIEAVVGGLLVGLVVPSLGNAVAAWRINRRRTASQAPQPPSAPAVSASQPAAAPAAPAAAQTPAFKLGAGPAPATPAAWRATHRVPAGGLVSWPDPSGDTPAGAQLDPGLQVQVAEERGEWARIVCDNGWTAWVDRRRLEPLG